MYWNLLFEVGGESFCSDMCAMKCVSGLFSVIMRDLSNLTSEGPKWIVLDGDIDPMWIESLNTVMDMFVLLIINVRVMHMVMILELRVITEYVK